MVYTNNDNSDDSDARSENDDDTSIEEKVDGVAVEAFRMANGLPPQPESDEEADE